MARPTKAINLSQEQNELLTGLAHSRTRCYSLVQRTQIILKASEGINRKRISQELGVSEDMVGLWRQRWIQGSAVLDQWRDKPKEWGAAISQLLADKPRPGSPNTFSSEQICQIIALACETPPSYLSHWSNEDLAREVVKRGIVKRISKTTLGRFLKSGGTQTAPPQILAESRG